MSLVILGRAISGTGGAGIMTISSIIITDIVPKREVATWRAYVNIAMTLGRSLGGPIGGWLSDTIGWRWYMPKIQLVLYFC
jgi:predicted MFS family arabinose efflux permease